MMDGRELYEQRYGVPPLRGEGDEDRRWLAAEARVYEAGYTQPDRWRVLLATLLHGVYEARHGVGGCRHD